jgi:hypothetical protein
VISVWSSAPILAATATTLTSRELEEVLFGAVSGVLSYLLAVYSFRSIGAYPWRLPPWLWGLMGLIFPPTLIVEAVARMTTRRVPRLPRSGTAPGALPGQLPGSGSPADRYPSALPQPGQWQPPGPRQQQDDAGAGAAWQQASADTPAAPPWPPPLGPEAFPPQHPGQPPHSVQPPYNAPAPYPGQPPYVAQPPYTTSQAGKTPGLPAQVGPEGWIPGSLYGNSPTPPPLFGWYADPTGRHEERYWDGRHWSDRVADNSVRSDDPLYPDADPGSDSPEAGAVGPGVESSGVTPDAADPPAGTSMSERLRGFKRTRG